MHTISQGRFFSKLRNFEIYDNQNEFIGRVGDLLLRKEDLSVYALISFDDIVRERLESLHIIDNRDEIIPLHHINREYRHTNQIQTTIPPQKIMNNTY